MITLNHRPLGWIAAALLVALIATPVSASDHADPIDPLRMSTDDDRGLTGLFAFPTKEGKRVDDPKDGDSLVLVLCVNRLLSVPPPYKGLDTYTFKIHVDTQREVRINYPKDLANPMRPEERDTARYGGVVVNPELIDPTFSITMRLKNDLGPFSEENFIERVVTVNNGDGEKTLTPAEMGKTVPQWGAGVRDDPFIFPPFFGTNVIAMVVRIPFANIPAPRGTFITWATVERNGAQFDHVGRSQRTQLPRFDFLNTIPPKEHVSTIKKMRTDPSLRLDVLRYLFPSEFAFRGFDDQPDVMVFTKDRVTGFPNGRRLQDDVAKLTCEQGDCQLYELSFAKPRLPESERLSQYKAGRPTANDKEFSDTWPYLAEPWPDMDPVPPPGLSTKNQIYVGSALALTAVVFLFPWVLYFRSKAQLRRLRATLPARVPQPPVPPMPLGPVTSTQPVGGAQ
ncbi:hypothetical protein VT84_30025 [Gemmata sp. SH-PL17]|uniref:DUF4331 family protein n=1 Tax=Gemmata sp. SH-PL17 TaxID=1630693 RepID=UPI00078E3D62|nr:DUF4331 family protein [Gemmata sp. SH-PL17]AMV28681.1 hypothetical protein VT84_30025 [Gemmata sp. SH-PL17]